MNSENKMRIFICIDFPDEIIKEIARIQSLVSKQNFTGKLTELENLHLTLKFLGEITPELLEKVKERLSKIKFPKLTLKLEKAGTFNIRGNPKIVWLKITGGIFDLQKEIDNSLLPLFPQEERFMSHLTIARIKYVKDKNGFDDYISKLKIEKIQFPCASFYLKKSELKPNGPVYTSLAEYSLG